jgi:hypothetical protein
MEKATLKKRTLTRAMKNAGSYSELAKRINRSYRALLMYRTNGEAPADVVAAIKAISEEKIASNE